MQFGAGVLHSTGSSNAAFAFMSETTFNKHIQKNMHVTGVTNESEGSQLSNEDLTQILNDFDAQQGGAHGL